MKNKTISILLLLTIFSFFQLARANTTDSLYYNFFRIVTNPHIVELKYDIILPIKVASDSGKYVVFISYTDLKYAIDSFSDLAKYDLDSLLFGCDYININKDLLLNNYSPFREFYVGDTLKMNESSQYSKYLSRGARLNGFKYHWYVKTNVSKIDIANIIWSDFHKGIFYVSHCSGEISRIQLKFN